MFGPYRTPPSQPAEAPPSRAEEELVLAWALILVGGVRVLGAVVKCEIWGAEPTLALLLVVLGLGMLFRRP